MMKQSNASSELLDKLVKAAENAKPKEFRNDFAHQIIPIMEAKQKTLDEIFQEVMGKKAQLEADLVGDVAPDPGLEGLGDEGAPPEGDELGGDLGAETDVPPGAEEDPASLVSQALELLQKAQTALGGGAATEEGLGESLGDDLDVSDEIPADTAVSDMVGGEDDISALPEAQEPKPMLMSHRIVPNGKKVAKR